MKKLVFALTKSDSKTRVLGIIAVALAVVAILMLAISSSKAINGPLTEIAAIKTFVPEKELSAIEDNFDEMIDEIEEAIDDEDEDYIEELEDETGIDIDKVLDLMDPISLKSLQTLSSMIEEDGAEETVQIFSIIINIIKWYAIILIAFVALSLIRMSKGFFITAVSISALYFFLFAGFALFFVFLALCIAYSILVGKVRKAYIIYDYEQKKLAEAPIVEEV